MTDAVVTGMTEQEADAASRLQKPMILYVYDDSKFVDARFTTEQSAEFRTEGIAVAARFFDCARMDLESAKEDRVLRKARLKGPALVFIRPNLEIATKMKETAKAVAIFSTMGKTLRKDYMNSAKTVLKKQRELNKVRAKLDLDRAKMVRLDERINDAKSAGKRRKLQKQRADIEQKLGDRTTKLEESEAKLYELVPKET